MKTRLLMTCLFSTISAFAAPEQNDGASTQTLSFADLKEACLNPARFHN